MVRTPVGGCVDHRTADRRYPNCHARFLTIERAMAMAA
jgi:hypothetical protein